MIPALVLALHVAVMVLVLFAAYEDVQRMRIRNTLAMAVAALFIPMLFLLPIHETSMHLIAGAVVFMIGLGLFFAGLLGGGDVKLLAALALWPDVAQLPKFLLIMAFAGGILALIAVGVKYVPVLVKFAQKCGENSWFGRLSRDEAVVPYGVALAIASALTLF